MIEGVKIKKLVKHCDDRGFLTEILRNDDNLMKRFGQSTFTKAYPGVIKAFHWHRKQDDLWFIFDGDAQVVLHDLRKTSPTYKQTQVIFAGEEDLKLIFIPKGVAHGYRVLGKKPARMIYFTSESYDQENPDEERIPFDDPKIGFDWETKNR
jgi:dTDP-4-dehydrorhamnose 3,5-epimerase